MRKLLLNVHLRFVQNHLRLFILNRVGISCSLEGVGGLQMGVRLQIVFPTRFINLVLNIVLQIVIVNGFVVQICNKVICFLAWPHFERYR